MNSGRILKASILPSSMPIANNKIALNWTTLNQSPSIILQYKIIAKTIFRNIPLSLLKLLIKFRRDKGIFLKLDLAKPYAKA